MNGHIVTKPLKAPEKRAKRKLKKGRPDPFKGLRLCLVLKSR